MAVELVTQARRKSALEPNPQPTETPTISNDDGTATIKDTKKEEE